MKKFMVPGALASAAIMLVATVFSAQAYSADGEFYSGGQLPVECRLDSRADPNGSGQFIVVVPL